MSAGDPARQQAERMRSVARNVRAQLAAELATLAARVGATMRMRAPKFRTTLANSVREKKESDLAWLVAPNTEYAVYREKGTRPGRGLPRFFDPAAADIVAWLEGRIGDSARKADPKWRPGRLGSKRRTAAELELRDRYEALSRYVYLHGTKATPFVAPTAEEFRQVVPNALVAAVRRGVSLAAGAGKAGAA